MSYLSNKFRAAIIAVLFTALLVVAGCGTSNADKVSENISKEAEKFNVVRRVVVTNGITEKPIFLIEGRCSFEDFGHRLDVVCKESKDKYRKASVGLGDQDSWASTQLETVNVSEYRTKIIFRPESIIPDFDLVTGS